MPPSSVTPWRRSSASRAGDQGVHPAAQSCDGRSRLLQRRRRRPGAAPPPCGGSAPLRRRRRRRGSRGPGSRRAGRGPPCRCRGRPGPRSGHRRRRAPRAVRARAAPSARGPVPRRSWPRPWYPVRRAAACRARPGANRGGRGSGGLPGPRGWPGCQGLRCGEVRAGRPATGPRRRPAWGDDLPGQVQFGGEIRHGGGAGGEGLGAAVQGQAGHHVAADAAAPRAGGLQDRGADAGAGQFAGGQQAGDPAAHHHGGGRCGVPGGAAGCLHALTPGRSSG